VEVAIRRIGVMFDALPKNLIAGTTTCRLHSGQRDDMVEKDNVENLRFVASLFLCCLSRIKDTSFIAVFMPLNILMLRTPPKMSLYKLEYI
jgi:hypothetical protein